MISKIFSTGKFSSGLVVGLLMGAILTACAGMKVYSSRPDLGGMYRKQDNELIKYADTKDWKAMTNDDFQEFLVKYAACQKELKECRDR